MDGSQALFADVRDAEEAARQAAVHKRAMDSIRAEKARQERNGYLVMSAMTSSESIADSPVMKLVHMFLIGFAMVMPIIAIWAIALGG
ncbi:hypothetical protein [Primorskyibacter sp. S187A]|uniref:hypothetical protein n=1 Tax=Primorskyibacter sp. S187A TaxID=3415130 RepID=UPI003C7D2F57